MRFAAPLLAICALSLAACGGGGVPLETPEPVLQASFGGQGFTAGTLDRPVDINIFNFSNAGILDMGLRQFGSNGPWRGSLQGQNPLNFGQANGSAFWLTLETGEAIGPYEIFVETTRGRIETIGSVNMVQIPGGTWIPGPTDLYIFSFDFGGQIPGGGNTGQ